MKLIVLHTTTDDNAVRRESNVEGESERERERGERESERGRKREGYNGQRSN